MSDPDIKRISRLMTIVTLLQTRQLITAANLAERFSVSKRTIYRDIRTLEQAGIPVSTEEGKGYYLLEGFRIPPAMFTENEVNAMITAGELLSKNKDSSLTRDFSSAIDKVRAILQYTTRDKAAMLADKIAISPGFSNENTSNSLSLIQHALTSHRVMDIVYQSSNGSKTGRQVEPFAFYYSLEEQWLLIAFCRLRNDYRMFRLDKLLSLRVLEERFEPHKLTLSDYLDEKRKKFTTPDTPLS